MQLKQQFYIAFKMCPPSSDIYIIVIRAQCGVYEIYKPEGPGCSAQAKRGRY